MERRMSRWGKMEEAQRTLEILGGQYNRAQMMVFDQSLNLRRYLGSIPAHQQALPEGPAGRFSIPQDMVRHE